MRRIVIAFVVTRPGTPTLQNPDRLQQKFDELRRQVARVIECEHCERKFRPFFGAFGKRKTFCSQECLDTEMGELKRFYNRLRNLR